MPVYDLVAGGKPLNCLKGAGRIVVDDGGRLEGSEGGEGEDDEEDGFSRGHGEVVEEGEERNWRSCGGLGRFVERRW